MDPVQIAKLKEEARKRYEADLAAIDRVAALANGKLVNGVNGTNGHTAKPLKIKMVAEADHSNGQQATLPIAVTAEQEPLIGTVRAVIAQLSGQFSKRDIAKEMAKKYPHIDLKSGNRGVYFGTVIKRLVEKDELEVVKEHTATSPTIYKRAR